MTEQKLPLAKPAEVAEHLGVPEKTLTQWRYLRVGPRWSKVGRHVRYRWSDVEKWVDAQACEQVSGGAA